MQTREILSIVALAALGLCLLCGLAKMAMKGDKAKKSCDHACSLLVFVAVVLVGVSQLIEENKDGYMDKGDLQPKCAGSCQKGRCQDSDNEHSYSGICRDTDKKNGKVMDKLMCSVEPGNIQSNQCPTGQQFLCDGTSPVPRCVNI